MRKPSSLYAATGKTRCMIMIIACAKSFNMHICRRCPADISQRLHVIGTILVPAARIPLISVRWSSLWRSNAVNVIPLRIKTCGFAAMYRKKTVTMSKLSNSRMSLTLRRLAAEGSGQELRHLIDSYVIDQQ